LVEVRARIALSNAFWDFVSFFGIQVFAIPTQWGHATKDTTFVF